MNNLGMPTHTPRRELMELMDALAGRRLIYIHAPAGSGKTVSAGLWIEHKKTQWDARQAWLTLDDYDNRVAGFCERLTGALAKLQPQNVKLRELATHPSFNTAPEEFAMRALSAFSDDGNRYILTIDDLHVIKNNEVLKLLPLFCRRLPESFIILLLSRAAPPDIFAGLMLKNELAIIDSSKLFFTRDEIVLFFNSNGRRVTKREAGDIYKLTGGWAIGLRALLLSGEGGHSRKLTQQHLEAFLKAHVWEKWDTKIRDCMKKASIVEELTPGLFSALTGVKNSSEILDGLVCENSFIRFTGTETYRFHDLFRDFLLKMLEQDGTDIKNAQLKKAGDWFYRNKDYYRAVEYYLKCGNKKGIAGSLSFMYDYNSQYASVEDTVAIIHMSVDDAIIKEYPFLLETWIWAAFVEGRTEDLETYLDRYYKLFPKIVLQNPRSAITRFILLCADQRKSMVEITKSLGKFPFRKSVRANTPSITQSLPFFHRSSREFSTEYFFNTDENLRFLKRAFAPLIAEYVILENLIRAGIAFEQGNLNKAQEYALSAGAKLSESFAPEFQFCSFMLLAVILDFQGQREEMQKVLAETEMMIDRYGAYYLNANYSAFICRMKLRDGDMSAARGRLEKTSQSTSGIVSFYGLYGHFTTARAYIAAGEYNSAIILLKKLLDLGEKYNRPLDTIEARILLAIVYWKKGRGEQTTAVQLLEQAIASAYPYRYTQIFVSEGADLANMLHRLQKRAVQQDSPDGVPSTFVKSLYLSAVAQSKKYKGMSGSRHPEKLKFTQQQKTVMRLLCEGCSHKEIAERMGIGLNGIKSHLKLIFKKLDVSGSVDAVLKIKEFGVLEMPGEQKQ